MPSHSEAPSGGAKPFASFLAFEKGSRCKSETIGGRYRSNGYVRRQPISHRASCDACITVAHDSINASSAECGASLAAFLCCAWERSIASRLAPTGDPGAPVKVRSAVRSPSRASLTHTGFVQVTHRMDETTSRRYSSNGSVHRNLPRKIPGRLLTDATPNQLLALLIWVNNSVGTFLPLEVNWFVRNL
jgi:hypothetical protein